MYNTRPETTSSVSRQFRGRSDIFMLLMIMVLAGIHYAYEPSYTQAAETPLTAITVKTHPVPLSFTVDGSYYYGFAMLMWEPGSLHNMSAGGEIGEPGIYFVFNHWSDGINDFPMFYQVPAPAVPTTYTAYFDIMFHLTTMVSPLGAGTVTPAWGGFFNQGTTVNLLATPNPNYAFSGWTGPVADASSAATTVVVSYPETVVTANFVALHPDLTIQKTHSDHFTRGQKGAVYSIRITNTGEGETSGPVTVVDLLPAGLVGTSLSGVGWSCSLATLTCTRSDHLAAGASYSPITLTVDVDDHAPSSIINTAMVSGGGEINAGNNRTDDTTIIRQEPVAVPAATGWGMMVFMVAAGLLPLYYLLPAHKRNNSAERAGEKSH